MGRTSLRSAKLLLATLAVCLSGSGYFLPAMGGDFGTGASYKGEEGVGRTWKSTSFAGASLKSEESGDRTGKNTDYSDRVDRSRVDGLSVRSYKGTGGKSKFKAGAEAEEPEQTLWSKYNVAGRKAMSDADYKRASMLFQLALIEAQKTGKDDLNLAATLNNIAELQRLTGKYSEAEKSYQRSLSIKEKLLGSNNITVSKTLGNIGNLYFHEKRYEEAEKYFRRALAIDQKVLGKDHPATVAIDASLAKINMARGNLDQVEPALKKALSVHQSVFGFEHPSVADDLINLGSYYEQKRSLQEAEHYYKRAMNVRNATLGAEHPDTIAAVKNHTAILKLLGRTTEASNTSSAAH